RVGLEQLDRRAGLVEIDLSALDRFDQDLRQLPNIDLQPDLERLARREALTDSAVLLAGDGAMQAELATPERFAAERVVAKDLPSLLSQLLRIVVDPVVELARRDPLGLHGRIGLDPAHSGRAARGENPNRECARRPSSGGIRHSPTTIGTRRTSTRSPFAYSGAPARRFVEPRGWARRRESEGNVYGRQPARAGRPPFS